MFKRIVGCVRGYRIATFLTLFFIAMEAVIECLIPAITADLINTLGDTTLSASEAMDGIIPLGLQLVLMAVLSLCCGGIAGVTCAKASAGFARNLRRDVFRQIQTFSFQNIDRFSTASLVTRMTTDINNAQMSFMMLTRIALRAPLLLIFSIIMAAREAGPLAASFAVVIPVLVTGLLLVARFAMPAFRRVFKKYDRLNESIEENVRGMRVVKGFSREEYEKQKFGGASESISKDFTKAERIVALNQPIMQLCIYFNMVFVLIVGSRLVLTPGNGIEVGQLSAMITYGMMILMQLMMLSMIYVTMTMSAESFKRIGQVLKEESSLTNPEDPVTEVKDGSITFRDVSFKYSAEAENYALSDIDLAIQSGMTVGILGGTGSSKTTLVQLIPRLYDVTEGAIEVGGVDVRQYDMDALRGQVAMVLQKNLLFAGTIKDNLRWGNAEATDEELIEACKLAQAHDFVMSFPEGYDTYIEQGGTNVSGGQKQRLCIARALLKKPKILILDDSTSAVDTKTDAFIRAGFKEYIPETTKIIIAQRVASVMDADKIVMMEGGRILAVGSHETLLETTPLYREIYESQCQTGEEGGDV